MTDMDAGTHLNSVTKIFPRMGETATTDAGQLDPAIWRIASVAAIGSFMAQLDAVMVYVSLSRLATDLRASLGAIQWVISGYLLALALNGWLVNRIGAKARYP